MHSPPSAPAPAATTLTGCAEDGPLGLYVHFPWCLQKCPYCDFLSIPKPRQDIPQRAYTDAVLQELTARAPWVGRRKVGSLFFGGGTPSLWEPRELGRVIAAARDHFELDAAVEITVECNPSSFDRRRAEQLLEQGVNRVSLGVQGLHDERLRFLGRLHDASGALRAVSDAVAAGVPRVSADLIFAVAGQSPEEACDEVTTVAELGITHLSAYALTIEEGTVFGALHRKGHLPLLEEDVAANTFEQVAITLQGLGFEHYEISNYARDGHRSRHNLGYWLGHDYLGLGCGAWGTVITNVGALRYRNTRVVERYLEQTQQWKSTALDRLPARKEPGLLDAIEPLSAETRVQERIMLGLRLRQGVDLRDVSHSCGTAALTTARQQAIADLVAQDRLRQQGERIWIPQHAWLFADAIIRELL